MNLSSNKATAVVRSSNENVLVFHFNENLSGLYLPRAEAKRFFKTNGCHTNRLSFTGINNMGNKQYKVIEC